MPRGIDAVCGSGCARVVCAHVLVGTIYENKATLPPYALHVLPL